MIPSKIKDRNQFHPGVANEPELPESHEIIGDGTELFPFTKFQILDAKRRERIAVKTEISELLIPALVIVPLCSIPLFTNLLLEYLTDSALPATGKFVLSLACLSLFYLAYLTLALVLLFILWKSIKILILDFRAEQKSTFEELN